MVCLRYTKMFSAGPFVDKMVLGTKIAVLLKDKPCPLEPSETWMTEHDARIIR